MASSVSMRARAVALLAVRPHSRFELGRKLRRFLTDGEATDQIDALLDEFERVGWVSDQQFAANWVEHRASRYGRQRLRAELALRGIDAQAAQAHLDTLTDSEYPRALSLWQRRFGGEVCTGQAERAKQARFLIQRGFSTEIAARIVSGRTPR
jgi:regulatory protein